MRWLVADSLYCPGAFFASHLDSYSHYLREAGEDAMSMCLNHVSHPDSPWDAGIADSFLKEFDAALVLDNFGMGAALPARRRIAQVAAICSPMPWEVRNPDRSPAYDCVLSSIPWMVDEAGKHGCRSCYIPLAFDTRARVCGIGIERDLGCIFIGTTGPNHQRRTQLLAELSDVVTVMPPVFGREYFRTLARAKVVFNVHAEWARGAGNAMRLYEAAGMGCKIVSDGAAMHPSDQFWMRWDNYNRPTDTIRAREAIEWATERDNYIDEPEQTAEEAVLTAHTYESRIPRLIEIARSL